MQVKRRLPTLPSDVGDDKTASASVTVEQLVQGPYRDAADAKLKRKRAIDAWLSNLDEAESMRAAMLRERALLEESVELDRRDLLERVRMKTTCKEPWEAMAGSESCRRCERCKRNVYDLSEMTRAEVEALFARGAEDPSVRLRLRHDGRVATMDCPVDASRKPLMMSAVAGAMSAVAVSGAVALACIPQFGGLQRVDYAEERRAFEQEIEELVAANARANEEARAAHLARAQVQQEAPPQLAPVVAAPQGLESERIGHNEYVVSRGFIERLMTSSERLARVMPYEQNGVVFGVRVFGLARRGPLERLGLRNGDVPLRVNGTSISTPDNALQAVMSVRTSNAFVVDVLRAGRVMTLRYTVLG